MFSKDVEAVFKVRNVSSNEHNASPALCSSPPPFLTIRVGEYWRVSTEGGKGGGCLRAKVEEADQLVPPVNGWQFYKFYGSSDPTLECSRDLSEPCKEIVVKLGGEAKKKWPRCEGRYLPVEGTIIRGRPVSAFYKCFQIKTCCHHHYRN